MRTKIPMLVIAFQSATDALKFDAACSHGRIIPLPGEVGAGCGLAYCMDTKYKKEAQTLLATLEIDYFCKVIHMY